MSVTTLTPEQENELNLMDNLLVKDENGQFSQPNIQKNTLTGTTLVPALSRVAQAALMPESDHFLMVLPENAKPNEKSHLVFHPEDAKEAEELAKTLPKDESKKYSLEKIVEKLVEKHQLKLTPENKKKFSTIIFDFFRNRKNAIIVREVLSENIMSAETILSEETVNSLVSVIKAIKYNIEQEGGLVLESMPLNKAKQISQEPVVLTEKDLAKDLGEAVEDLAKELPSGPVEELEKELNAEISEDAGLDEKEVQGEIQNILSDLPKAKKIDNSVPAEKIAEKPAEVIVKPLDNQMADKQALETKSEPIIEEQRPALVVPVLASIEPVVAQEVPLPKVSRPKMVNEKQVVDVKQRAQEIPRPQSVDFNPPPKQPVNLTGPIEELQSFSLDNFRRLANSPSEQGAKLLSKINVLEKDSVTKKAQGIEAWRNSPIYRQYLSIGTDSLSQGKDVAAIIAQYQQNNQETLTMEEFSAISDLNKNLRF